MLCWTDTKGGKAQRKTSVGVPELYKAEPTQQTVVFRTCSLGQKLEGRYFKEVSGVSDTSTSEKKLVRYPRTCVTMGTKLSKMPVVLRDSMT